MDFIVGREAFIEGDKEQFLSLDPEYKGKPQLNVSASAKSFATDSEQILAKGRKNNLARDIAIDLSMNLTGFSGKELGEYFGGISGAAITMRHKAVASKKSSKTQNS